MLPRSGNTVQQMVFSLLFFTYSDVLVCKKITFREVHIQLYHSKFLHCPPPQISLFWDEHIEKNWCGLFIIPIYKVYTMC